MKPILIALVLLVTFDKISVFGQIGVADPVTGNATINFYGRVVDDENKPVAGANVRLRVMIGYLASPTQLGNRYETFTVPTDGNGNFQVTNKSGHSVEVQSIESKGYKLSSTVARLYPYSWSGNIFHPDPANPVLFVLWRNAKNRDLIDSDEHFDIIPDGRPYVVRFDRSGIRSETNVDGDFQFRLIRPKAVGKRDRFDWSFFIEGQNGNMLQASDKDFFEMNFAPEQGFSESYEETHPASDPQWRRAGRKQFFFKLGAGGGYGRVSLHWDMVAGANGPKTHEAGIQIRYTINRSGLALAR